MCKIMQIIWYSYFQSMPSIFNTINSTNKIFSGQNEFCKHPILFPTSVMHVFIYIAAYNDQNDKSPLSIVFMQKYD